MTNQLTENFTIGRGKVHVNNRYVGNTARAEVVDCGVLAFEFDCEDISPENLAMFFGPVDLANIEYVAKNPHGANIDLEMTGNLYPVRWPMKGEQWTFLSFRLIPSGKGIITHNRGIQSK